MQISKRNSKQSMINIKKKRLTPKFTSKNELIVTAHPGAEMTMGSSFTSEPKRVVVVSFTGATVVMLSIKDSDVMGNFSHKSSELVEFTRLVVVVDVEDIVVMDEDVTGKTGSLLSNSLINRRNGRGAIIPSSSCLPKELGEGVVTLEVSKYVCM